MREYYHVKKLKDNIYRITSLEGVYCDLFVGGKNALLWDTGYGFGDLKSVIRKITDKPLIIVNSHGHLDHACGNGRFEEDIYIHPLDMELCKAHTAEAVRRHAVKNSRESVDVLTGKSHNLLPKDFDEAAYYQMGSGHLCPVIEGHVFDLGGITLRVIETPGHTQGSISLVCQEEKWLYAGDAMNAFLWLFAEEACPLSVYINTLEKAQALGMEKLIVAHYPDILDIDVLDAYMDCARHVDYENGIPFDNPILPGYEARICSNFKMTQESFGDPYKASIVISKEKIDC